MLVLVRGTWIQLRTVGNGSVVSRLVEAVGRERVGNTSELRLDQSICYWIVEPLETRNVWLAGKRQLWYSTGARGVARCCLREYTHRASDDLLRFCRPCANELWVKLGVDERG